MELQEKKRSSLRKIAIFILLLALFLLFSSCSSGNQKEGFVTKNGKTFYYKEGTPTVGKAVVGGKTYYFDENGELQTGFLTLENQTFYFHSDGAMAVGAVQIEGKSYFFGDDGSMIIGWHERDGKKYYYNADGTLQTQKLEIDGKTYYFLEDGSMAVGWFTLNNKKYYMDEEGQPAVSLQEIEGSLYFFDANGLVTSRLISEKGKLYFFGADGKAVTGWQTVDDKKYYFQADRTAVTSKITISSKLYFFHSDGTLIVNQVVSGYQTDANGVATLIPKPEPKLDGPLTGNAKLDANIKKILVGVIDDSMSLNDKLYAAYSFVHSKMKYTAMTVDLSNGYTTQLVYSLAESSSATYKGSCEHYASLLYVLFQRLGVEPMMVPGSFLRTNTTDVWVEHVWVIAKVGGEYYHFDPLYARYNRPDPKSFFMKKDAEVENGRRWDKTKFPAC